MKKYILSFLILLISNGLFAQLDRSVKPKSGPAPEIKLGETSHFELKNGLKVYVVENHKLPKISLKLDINTGPILEADKTGLLSAVGHLMIGGTTQRDKEQLNEEIDFLGANISAWATGAKASGLTKYTDNIFTLVSEMALQANFNQQELDKWKTQARSELKANEKDPNTIASKISSIALFGKEHVYGEFMTEASIDAITLEDCKQFYKKYFKPNIAHMSIVGDITPKQAKKMVKKYFSKWEVKQVVKTQFEAAQAPDQNLVALFNMPTAVQSVINVTYPIDLKKGHEDIMTMSVLNQILGGGSAGRLFQNLREDKAFTYGAYSNFKTDQLIGKFSASASVRTNVTDSAVQEILSEMKNIRDTKITAEELRSTKNSLAGKFAISMQNPGTTGNFALNIAKYNLPKDYYQKYLQRLEAVTIEDVQRVAQKYIQPANTHIVIIGNTKEFAAKMTKFGQINYYNLAGDIYQPSLPKMPKDL